MGGGMDVLPGVKACGGLVHALEIQSAQPFPVGASHECCCSEGGAPSAPGSPSSAPGPCTHHQTLEELRDLGELAALGALVAADSPHQHEDGHEEALLWGFVLARGQVVEQGGGVREWEHQRGRRAAVTCGSRASAQGGSAETSSSGAT